MIKQQVWIANTSLVLLILVCVSSLYFLQKDLPVLRIKKSNASQEALQSVEMLVNLEKIYSNDLFDTYVMPMAQQPTKKNLVNPIPQLNLKAKTPPPPVKKVSFLAPLSLTIKGIILSKNEKQSVAMIADQTGKENMYHVGEQVQDAQILKIGRNKIVLLRTNGQQEVLFLRKPENLAQTGESRWGYAVKKIEENQYQIDIDEFTQEVTTIGQFVELLHLGTAYKNSKPIGVRIGIIDQFEVGSVLGLQQNDIITAINGLPTNNPQSRTSIYDAIRESKNGSTITVDLTRNGQALKISYSLNPIDKPSKYTFLNSNPSGSTPNQLAMTKEAEKAKRRRNFEIKHRSKEQQQTAVDNLHQQLFENLRKRSVTRRVR